jgi:nicotinate phosphoribosyltransferase
MHRPVPATHIDLYQLTSLVPHYLKGRCDDPVVMSFFSRRLPKHVTTGEPARGYLLFAGLRRCLEHLQQARFDDARLQTLLEQPLVGPTLRRHPALIERLRRWRFRGTIRAPREGTPLVSGAALRRDGRRLNVDDVRPAAYTPYLEVETDLLSAKLIETPLLSILNHMTMVASKASRVVSAARSQGEGRAVLEFGTRRTHPEAAVDAALAAWIAGCAATSNVEAHARHGVPVAGTMDHFAIQAWEEDGVPRHVTEQAFFRAFHEQFPGRDTLLVDTYDTFGAHTGIRAAVRATDGAGPHAIRLDSALTRDNLQRARALLDELGATSTRIVVSGGIDEDKIAALGDAPIDGYGVGERIVTSPDAPVGVGAVGKLSLIRGAPTMKLSRSTGKATLPGRLQVWRHEGADLVGLQGESHPGEPLLHTVYDEHGPRDLPDYGEVRDHAARALAALPEARRTPRHADLPVTDALASLVEGCVGLGLGS